jgi:hypothetical protein
LKRHRCRGETQFVLTEFALVDFALARRARPRGLARTELDIGLIGDFVGLVGKFRTGQARRLAVRAYDVVGKGASKRMAAPRRRQWRRARLRDSKVSAFSSIAGCCQRVSCP